MKTSNLAVLSFTFVTAAVMLGGCIGAEPFDGGDGLVEEANPAQVTAEAEAGLSINAVQIASIRSEGRPQGGQKHRSSGNFGTDTAPGGYSRLCWRVSGTSRPGSVVFDVMRDVSGGHDPVVYSGLVDGSKTDIKRHRSLYIANPRRTSGSFLVTVSAC